MSYLDSIYLAPLPFQFFHILRRILMIRPFHRLFSAKSGLVYLTVRRRGGNATEGDMLHTKGVGGAEYRTYIVQRTHIVKHHRQRKFLTLAEFFHRHAVHFLCCQLI